MWIPSDYYKIFTKWTRGYVVTEYPRIHLSKVAGYSAVKPTNADNIHRPLQKDWEADVLSAIQKGYC